MPDTYVLETLSDFRCFLKREGYGYVAQVIWNDANMGKGWLRFPRPNDLCDLQMRPVNAGVDMTPAELRDAYEGAGRG